MTSSAKNVGGTLIPSRVSYLSAGSSSGSASLLGALWQGLRELGRAEGKNIVMEYRFAEGRYERLPDLARKLIQLDVEAIAATPSPAVAAAHEVIESEVPPADIKPRRNFPFIQSRGRHEPAA
jgi:hypothetical protein